MRIYASSAISFATAFCHIFSKVSALGFTIYKRHYRGHFSESGHYRGHFSESVPAVLQHLRPPGIEHRLMRVVWCGVCVVCMWCVCVYGVCARVCALRVCVCVCVCVCCQVLLPHADIDLSPFPLPLSLHFSVCGEGKEKEWRERQGGRREGGESWGGRKEGRGGKVFYDRETWTGSSTVKGGRSTTVSHTGDGHTSGGHTFKLTACAPTVCLTPLRLCPHHVHTSFS